MDIQLTKKDASKQPPARSRADFFARGGILAAGLICLLLLAWGHLGLDALLFPPAPTVAQQTVVTGPYTVALQLPAGQLTARGPNTVVLHLQDQAGHAINNASLRVTPEMTTMPMTVPAAVAWGKAMGSICSIPPLAWPEIGGSTSPSPRLGSQRCSFLPGRRALELTPA